MNYNMLVVVLQMVPMYDFSCSFLSSPLFFAYCFRRFCLFLLGLLMMFYRVTKVNWFIDVAFLKRFADQDSLYRNCI